MSETKHTPGPWHVGLRRGTECDIYDADGILVASAKYNPPGREHSTEQMVPNARFIVRACNSHEELLELLKECQRQRWSGDRHRTKDPLLERVTEAIAKAEAR